MEYIRIKDNIVVELISAPKKPNGAWKEVSLHDGIHIGDDIRMFDTKWNLKPIVQLVSEGLIDLEKSDGNDGLPAGTVLQKIENDSLVYKNEYDFAKEGSIKLELMQYLDDDKKTIKTAETFEKLVEIGKITKKEAIEYQKDEARKNRNEMLDELDFVVMNPLRWNSFSSSQQEAIAVYRQQLLDVPQQKHFPNNIDWPIKPDFI